MIDHRFPKSSKFRKKFACANLLFFTSLLTCNAVSDEGTMVEGGSTFNSRLGQRPPSETMEGVKAINELYANTEISNPSPATNMGKYERITRDSYGRFNGGQKLAPGGGAALSRSRRKRRIISSMENYSNHDKNRHENFPALSQVRDEEVGPISTEAANDTASRSHLDDLKQNKKMGLDLFSPEIHTSNYAGMEPHLKRANISESKQQQEPQEQQLQQIITEENPIHYDEEPKDLVTFYPAEVKVDLQPRHRIRHLAKKGGHREIKLRFLEPHFREGAPLGNDLNEYAAQSVTKQKSKQLMKEDVLMENEKGNSSNRTFNEELSDGGPINDVRQEASLITLKRHRSPQRSLFNGNNYPVISGTRDLEADSDSSISASNEDYYNFEHLKHNLIQNFRKQNQQLLFNHGQHLGLSANSKYSEETPLPTPIILSRLKSDVGTLSHIDWQLMDGTSTKEKTQGIRKESLTTPITAGKVNNFDPKTSPRNPKTLKLESPINETEESNSWDAGTQNPPDRPLPLEVVYANDEKADLSQGFADSSSESYRRTTVQRKEEKFAEDDFDLHNSFHKGKNLLTTTSEAALLLAIPLALLLTLIILTFAACCCYRHRQLHFVQHQDKGQVKLLGYYDEFGHNPEENGCCGCRALESCCLPDLSYQLHRAEWVKKNSISENEKSFVVFEDDLDLSAEVGADLIGHPPLYDLLSNLPPRRRRSSHSARKYSNRKTTLRKTKSVELLCV